MMHIGLARLLLILFGLTYILSTFGAIWLGNFFFWLPIPVASNSTVCGTRASSK